MRNDSRERKSLVVVSHGAFPNDVAWNYGIKNIFSGIYKKNLNEMRMQVALDGGKKFFIDSFDYD